MMNAFRGDFAMKVFDAGCKDFLKALQAGFIFQSGENIFLSFFITNFFFKILNLNVLPDSILLHSR
jgi:hypothetical protein